MKVGFAPSGTRRADEAVAVAVAVEQAGFDEVWLSEDYFERGAFALAGAVAASTSRVALGVGVVNPWTRHPVLTAMEFAGLDELSAGRAVLGLGASNSRWMSDQLGIAFEAPLGRLVECVEIIRAVLAGAPVSHHGAGWDVEAALSFSPLRTDPPIVLGVKGRRALSRAGQVADGVFLSVLSSPDYVRWARSQVARPDCTMSSYALWSCEPDAAAARDAIRPTVAKYLGVHGDHDITRQAGIDPDLAARFRAALLAGRPAVDLVSDDLIDVLAVAGDREMCAARLHRLQEAGLETVVLLETPGGSTSHVITEARACVELAGIG
ncbi:MAG: 5,10-methylenetetrahydromethanopterin reductase [Pseudonocardiales bacterium]|nr:5,10-methylenetetrahydromethanopterin reductase [Pseudonocardiales bacterium]